MDTIDHAAIIRGHLDIRRRRLAASSQPIRKRWNDRTYDRGTAPCGNCNLGRHQICRLRLDGVSCSCSCPLAEVKRAEIKVFQNN